MSRLPLLFIAAAATCLTAGVAMGLSLGIVHDFPLAPVHAHEPHRLDLARPDGADLARLAGAGGGAACGGAALDLGRRGLRLPARHPFRDHAGCAGARDQRRRG
jgi:hypothetical protein